MNKFRRFSLFAMSALWLLPSLAFASNHTPSDQVGHFFAHLKLMCFWLSQGQWSLAFYQADCTQDALSKLLFVHGGIIVLLLLPLAIGFWAFHKKIAQHIHEKTWFLRFRGRYS